MVSDMDMNTHCKGVDGKRVDDGGVELRKLGRSNAGVSVPGRPGVESIEPAQAPSQGCSLLGSPRRTFAFSFPSLRQSSSVCCPVPEPTEWVGRTMYSMTEPKRGVRPTVERERAH